MTIAFDAVSRSGTAWTTGQSSLTWSHTVGAGTNRALVVAVGTYSATARTVTGITYNGVALTKIDAQTAALEANNQSGELWVLAAPAVGTANVVVTFSGTADFCVGFAESYTGDANPIQIGAVNKVSSAVAASSNPACSVNVTHSGAWLVGMAYSRSTNITPSNGRPGAATGLAINDSAAAVSTGTQTITYATLGDTATWPAVILAEIYEGSSGGAFSGSVTADDGAPTGSFAGGSASGFTGAVTADDAAPTGSFAMASGTITSVPLKRNTGALSGSTTLTWCGVRNASTGAHVLLLTGVGVNSSSIFSISDPSLIVGTSYLVDWLEAGGQRGHGLATAA